MKINNITASFCVGLMLMVSLPKPIKAEPISTLTIIKIVGGILSVAGFWIALQNATRAEHEFAANSVLKHLGSNAEFPVSSCISPDIQKGIEKKGWLVSIDDRKYLRSFIKSDFCKNDGQSKNGKYVIGIFSTQYHAKKFGTVVRYRTENQINVYVSKEAVNLSGR